MCGMGCVHFAAGYEHFELQPEYFWRPLLPTSLYFPPVMNPAGHFLCWVFRLAWQRERDITWGDEVGQACPRIIVPSLPHKRKQEKKSGSGIVGGLSAPPKTSEQISCIDVQAQHHRHRIRHRQTEQAANFYLRHICRPVMRITQPVTPEAGYFSNEIPFQKCPLKREYAANIWTVFSLSPFIHVKNPWHDVSSYC